MAATTAHSGMEAPAAGDTQPPLALNQEASFAPGVPSDGPAMDTAASTAAAAGSLSEGEHERPSQTRRAPSRQASSRSRRRSGSRGSRGISVHKKPAPVVVQRPRVDYVQRLRNYRETSMHQARSARTVDVEDPRLILPDLKTALDAVAKRDAAAAAAAAAGRASRQSSVGAGGGYAAGVPRTPPGGAFRTGSSQGRRASKRSPHHLQTPPRTPPRAPGGGTISHRLRGSSSITATPLPAPSTAPTISTPGPAAASAPLEAGLQQPSGAPQSSPPQLLLPPIAATEQQPAQPQVSPLAAGISLPPIAPAQISPHASQQADAGPLLSPTKSCKGQLRPTGMVRPSAAAAPGLVPFQVPAIGGGSLMALINARLSGPGVNPGSQAPAKPRIPSAFELYQDKVQVDTSGLFHPDRCMQPDLEDEEQLRSTLSRLKETSDQKDKDEEVTYSHLLKPRAKSARGGAAVFPGSEDGWDAEVTLAWSNRGISVKKLHLLQDMLVQHNFLTGLQLSGNSINNDCLSMLLDLLARPGAPRITQLDLSANKALDWRSAYAIARALGAENLTAPEPADTLRQVATDPSSVCVTASAAMPPPRGQGLSMRAAGAPLPLARLALADVRLGDRGATAIAAALKASRTLTDLNLSRCSIMDLGGASIAEALKTSSVRLLDLSWNSLRAASARALQDALDVNTSLEALNLGFNGLSDTDTSRILKGLTRHGTWRHVDLSNNNLSAGSALVLSEVVSLLGKRCAQIILKESYAVGWPSSSGSATATARSSRSSFPGSRPVSGRPSPAPSSAAAAASAASKSPRRVSEPPKPREVLGHQLASSPVLLNVSGNPLGLAGLREVLRSLDWMSMMVEDAVAVARDKRLEQKRRERAAAREAARAAAEAEADKAQEGEAPPLEQEPSEVEDPEPDTPLPEWPLQVIIDNCNVDIADVAPDDGEAEGMDLHSPNPFVPSLLRAAGWANEAPGATPVKAEVAPPSPSKAPAAKVQPAGKKPAGKDKAANDAQSLPPRPKVKYPLTAQSQRLDLQCPAGKYVLDMSHPASGLVVQQLVSLVAEMETANRQSAVSAAGSTSPSVVVKVTDVYLNDKPSSTKRLETAHELEKGCLCFTVDAPAIVTVALPIPTATQLVSWLGTLLSSADERCSDLWKLSVVRVACSHFFFSCEQAVQLLERYDAAASLRVQMAELLYARCSNPLDFWLRGTRCLSPSQVDALMDRLGEFPAFDTNNPAGRYSLSLSRTVDRAIASRLQEAAILEGSWAAQSRHLFNWRNAALDGRGLKLESARQLRKYTIPDTGTLTLDFVTYKAPAPHNRPCTEPQLCALLSQLCDINRKYGRDLLQAAHDASAEHKAELLAAARAVGMMRSATRKPAHAEKKEEKRWPLLRVLATPLKRMAAEMRVPEPPPPPSRTVGRQANAAHKPAMVRQGSRITKSGSPQTAPPSVWWWQDAADGPFRTAARTLMNTKSDAGAGLSGTSRSTTRLGAEASRGGGLMPESSRRSVAATDIADDGSDEEEEPLPPPYLRCPGAHMTQQQDLQVQQLTVQVLQVAKAREAVLLLSKCGPVTVARVVHTLVHASSHAGPKIAAMLLEPMAPALAIRLLYSSPDQTVALLPPEERQQLIAACNPELLERLSGLQAAVASLAARRLQQIRIALQCFASAHFVSTAQLGRIVNACKTEVDRCTAIVTLYSRLLDREFLYAILQGMSEEEQRQVMLRLGTWYVWQALQACPQDWGQVRFCLHLSDPEHNDVAREIVQMACRATMAMKAQNPSQDVRQLLDMKVDGLPTTLEEDDRMWSHIEGCQWLEFMFAPSIDQTDAKREASAIKIQRAWRKMRALWRQLYQVLE